MTSRTVSPSSGPDISPLGVVMLVSVLFVDEWNTAIVVVAAPVLLAAAAVLAAAFAAAAASAPAAVVAAADAEVVVVIAALFRVVLGIVIPAVVSVVADTAL